MVLCLRTSIIYTVRVRKAAEATALSSGFLGLHPPPPTPTPPGLLLSSCTESQWDQCARGVWNVIKSLGITQKKCKAARRSEWGLILHAARCWRGCGECNGKRVLPKCSEAVLLLCTQQLMCSALTPIVLYCSLLDTVPNTPHVRSARQLLLCRRCAAALWRFFHRRCLRLSHRTAQQDKPG